MFVYLCVRVPVCICLSVVMSASVSVLNVCLHDHMSFFLSFLLVYPKCVCVCVCSGECVQVCVCSGECVQVCVCSSVCVFR